MTSDGVNRYHRRKDEASNSKLRSAYLAQAAIKVGTNYHVCNVPHFHALPTSWTSIAQLTTHCVLGWFRKLHLHVSPLEPVYKPFRYHAARHTSYSLVIVLTGQGLCLFLTVPETVPLYHPDHAQQRLTRLVSLWLHSISVWCLTFTISNIDVESSSVAVRATRQSATRLV